MKSRKLGIALLVMLAFVVTTGTFAYWATSVSGPANDTTVGTVTVGSGNAVTTSFTLTDTNASGGELVPAGQTANSAGTPVESVSLVYEVEWAEDAATSQLAGTSSTGDITVTPVVTMVESDGTTAITGPTLLALVVVTPDAGNAASLTLGAAAETFTFVVTLTEPANSTDYAVIESATITVTFTYALSNIQTTDN